MPSCVLRKCKNYGSKINTSEGISYHTFPSDDFTKHKWVSIVQAERSEHDWMPTKSSTICFAHFKQEDKYTTSKGYMRLKKTAVPLIGSENHDGGSSEITVGTANADNTFQLDISMNEDSLQADDGKEIKVFCPKCNVEITHTAEGIQEDQTKIVIAKVYHYFEQEYEELKKSFNGLALTPLSKFRQRTALATGVSETTVLEILQEEARRNADVREGPSQTEGPARKRPRQTDSSSEEESENSDDGDVTTQSSTVHGEVLTLVIKEEPEEESLESYNEESEIYVERPEVKDEPAVSGANDALADPISIDFKTEPRTEESTSSNDTPVVQSATKSYNEAPTAASAPPAPPGRQLLLLHEGDIKTEQIESEEGFR